VVSRRRGLLAPLAAPPTLAPRFPLFGLAIILAIRFFIAHHSSYEVEWPDHPFYFFSGADQFVVFGERYRYISAIVLAFGLLMAGLDLRRAPAPPPGGKTAFSFSNFASSPFASPRSSPKISSSAKTPVGSAYSSPASLSSPPSTPSVFSARSPRKSGISSLSLLAPSSVSSFSTGTPPSSLASKPTPKSSPANLPFGTRVLKTVAAPGDWRAPFIYHSIDRVCIGHCFAFSNYEASTKQFRLRVHEDSPVVVFDPDDSESMDPANM